MRIRKWLGPHCHYTSAYLDTFQPQGAQEAISGNEEGRARISIVETDLNKHPGGTPNENAQAKSECTLIKKSILMNRPRKLN